MQAAVLDGLRDRLMDPVLFEAFAAEFIVEWSRLQAALGGGFTARNAKLNKTEDQVERLVDALANGTSASAVKGRLRMAEDRRLALEAEGGAAAMELAWGLVGSCVLILCVGCGDRI